MSRTIRVKGEASVSAKPDLIELKINGTSVHYDYAKTVEEASKQTRTLRKVMEESGLSGEDLKTKSFHIETEYKSYRDKNDEYQRRFIGYRYRQTHKIRFKLDNKQLGKTLWSLAHSDLNVEFSLSYTVENHEPIKKKLLEEAVQNSREKAEILATASGVKLGLLQSIDYSWIDMNLMTPTYRIFEDSNVMSAEMSDSYDIDIDPEDIEATDTVTIVWGIE